MYRRVCSLYIEELPDYVIAAVILGFLLVVVLIIALLAYRSMPAISILSSS